MDHIYEEYSDQFYKGGKFRQWNILKCEICSLLKATNYYTGTILYCYNNYNNYNKWHQSLYTCDEVSLMNIIE